MSISEQVKELREYANVSLYARESKAKELMKQAADTIEAISAKLETANKELERWHTDKINDKIKNPFAWTSTLCCHNCDHKDEYIEELEAADMGQTAEVCGGGWIPCKERLPEEDKDVLIYTPHDGVDIAYISDENWRYSRGDDFIGTLEKANVLAWQPLPEKYQE